MKERIDITDYASLITKALPKGILLGGADSDISDFHYTASSAFVKLIEHPATVVCFASWCLPHRTRASDRRWRLELDNS